MYKTIGFAAVANGTVIATVLPNTGYNNNSLVTIAVAVIVGMLTWAIAYKLLSR